MKLRKELEFFTDNCKTKLTGQFSFINETIYKWYGKCCPAGIYPFGSLQKGRGVESKGKLKRQIIGSLQPPMAG